MSGVEKKPYEGPNPMYLYESRGIEIDWVMAGFVISVVALFAFLVIMGMAIGRVTAPSQEDRIEQMRDCIELGVDKQECGRIIVERDFGR